MKHQTRNRIFAVLTAAALSALLLASCGKIPPEPSSSVPPMPDPLSLPESAPESAPAESAASAASQPAAVPGHPAAFTTPEQFLLDIQPNLNCLDQCDADLYGAAVEWDAPLIAYVRADGDDKIAALKPADEAIPEGYVQHPACAEYYHISNYIAMEDVVAWLEQYMTPEMAAEMLSASESELLEFYGGMYLVRGGRGYGTVSMDWGTLEYRREEDNQHVVGVQCIAFDEYDSTRELYFAADPDGWKLTRMDILDEAVG